MPVFSNLSFFIVEGIVNFWLIINFSLIISHLLIISFWLTFSDTTIDYYQQQPEGLVQASHSTKWLKIACHVQYQEIADNQEIADVKCQSTKWLKIACHVVYQEIADNQEIADGLAEL